MKNNAFHTTMQISAILTVHLTVFNCLSWNLSAERPFETGDPGCRVV